MAKQKLKKQDTGFAQVKNEVLCDSTLSLKAKGLFAYLYSKPDNWDFSGHRMASECKETKDTIYKVLKELEEAGYLTRKRLSTGKVSYDIAYNPNPKVSDRVEKPNPKNAQVEKRPVGKVRTISNKEIKQIRKKKVISNSKAVALPVENSPPSRFPALQGNQWNQLIDSFAEVNPLYEDFYKNTTERKALDHLAARLGFEKVHSIILQLPALTSQKYAPKITKPSELKRDLGRLITFYKQNQQKETKYGGTKIY